MTADPAPDRKDLEDQARRLLELARRRAGVSIERMVKSLGELQPRGAETRRSWYDWQEKPETISLLTGLAAMHALGPDATMELVFGVTAGREAGDSDVAADRIARLEGALGEVVTEGIRLRERVEDFVIPELEKQGELITKILADMKDAGILKVHAEEEASETKRGVIGR